MATRIDGYINELFSDTYLYYLNRDVLLHNNYTYDKQIEFADAMSNLYSKIDTISQYFGSFYDKLVASVPFENLPEKEKARMNEFAAINKKANPDMDISAEKIHESLGDDYSHYSYKTQEFDFKVPGIISDNTGYIGPNLGEYKNFPLFQNKFKQNLIANNNLNHQNILTKINDKNRKIDFKSSIQEIPLEERIEMVNKMSLLVDTIGYGVICNREFSQTMYPNNDFSKSKDLIDIGNELGINMESLPKYEDSLECMAQNKTANFSR